MIELKGNRECFFLKSDDVEVNNRSGEIVDNNKIKFVFFYEPIRMIEFLYSKRVKFSVECFGHGSLIYIDLNDCVFIDE